MGGRGGGERGGGWGGGPGGGVPEKRFVRVALCVFLLLMREGGGDRFSRLPTGLRPDVRMRRKHTGYVEGLWRRGGRP